MTKREKTKQPDFGVTETAHLTNNRTKFEKNYGDVTWGTGGIKEKKCKRCNDTKVIYLTKGEASKIGKKHGENPCPKCQIPDEKENEK